MSTQDDASQPLPNARHERFAFLLATSGLSQIEAYEQAGYKPDSGAAARMSANVRICQRIAYLHRRNVEKADVAAAAAGVTAESIVAELEEARQMAIQERKSGEMREASIAKAKMSGLWVERSERTSIQADARELSDAELTALIAAETSAPDGQIQ